jgi:hypothetical protein
MKPWLGAVAIMLLGLPGFASALTIKYRIGSYHSADFSASSLHKAGGCRSGGHYTCGKTVHKILSGFLRGDWDEDLNGGTLSDISGKLSPRLSITDGEYSNTQGGWMNFKYGKKVLGTFYFAAGQVAGPANAITDSVLYLRGQTWLPGTPKPLGMQRFGLNLYGQGSQVPPPKTRPSVPPQPVPTPEPGTVVLLGTGLLGTVGYLRRRRQLAA